MQCGTKTRQEATASRLHVHSALMRVGALTSAGARTELATPTADRRWVTRCLTTATGARTRAATDSRDTSPSP